MDERSPNELSLLGGFVFAVGGDALVGISAGSQRLIAFLALRDRRVTRTEVAGTLWPESTDERAGASLRSAVAGLDGSDHAVRVTALDLGLDEGVVVDVHRSHRLAHGLVDLARGQVGADAPPYETDIDSGTVAALSEDLLPGWYDDWALIAAADWHQLRFHALEALAARLTAADRLPEAGAAALAAVRAEPLRESARAALIRVRAAEGSGSDAIGEFERYRVLLHAELGLEPTSRLTDLLRELEL